MPADLDGPPPPAGTPNFFAASGRRRSLRRRRPARGLRLRRRLGQPGCVDIHADRRPADRTRSIRCCARPTCSAPACRSRASRSGSRRSRSGRCGGCSTATSAATRAWSSTTPWMPTARISPASAGTSCGAPRPALGASSSRAPSHRTGRIAGWAASRWTATGTSLSATRVASGSVFPGLRQTGRLATDPPGTLPQAETDIIVGSGAQTHPARRWGNYSSMDVDPTRRLHLLVHRRVLQHDILGRLADSRRELPLPLVRQASRPRPSCRSSIRPRWCAGCSRTRRR